VLKVMQAEASAIEQAMHVCANGAAAQRAALDALQGKRIVYVGGRPGSNAVIARIVHRVLSAADRECCKLH
jgi:hypothetical protein